MLECTCRYFKENSFNQSQVQLEYDSFVSLHLRARRMGGSKYVAAALIRAFSRFCATYLRPSPGDSSAQPPKAPSADPARPDAVDEGSGKHGRKKRNFQQRALRRNTADPYLGHPTHGRQIVCHFLQPSLHCCLGFQYFLMMRGIEGFLA